MTHLTGAALIKQRLAAISHRPGVYRMISEKGVVLYVGKAKDLHKRLTNYTRVGQLSVRIARMVGLVHDLIVIETAGETEAFLLENDLIKQFRPYYNILLKDDKSFPYIVLTKDTVPRLMKYRGVRGVKGDYFGPYASGLAVSQTIREIQKIFGLRVCTNTYFANRTRPCLLYQIHRCSGPCVGCISQEEYLKTVRDVKAFLRGEQTQIQQILTRQMQAFSKAEAFEQAAAVRDKILALNKVQGTDREIWLAGTDVVALYREGDEACISVFFYRSGKAEGNSTHFLSDVADVPSPEIMTTFLMQFYDQVPAPRFLCLSETVPTGFADALAQKTGHTVQISSAFKGMRRKLMEQAVLNARESLSQHRQNEQITDRVWAEFRDLLELKHLNKVEVYDNSHIQGASAVGAMIVATKEGFQKNLYRRFNIQAELTRTNDDFGMMRQVLRRRLTRGLAEGDLPDALIIDGGKGQISAVLDIVNELHVTNVAVLGVAKGEDRNAGRETFYLGSRPHEPIRLDFKSDLIHLIQRLRDEAHRFAIGSHRIKRAKNMFHETLSEIGGIGQKRKKALLLHFGSPREIAGASLDQLCRVDGISEKIAKKIYTFYHG